jgi:hypothetical protein
MLKSIWIKIIGHRQENKEESFRESSEKLGIPKSTIHYHEKRRNRRIKSSGNEVWESSYGQWFLKRMIVSVIYTFGIKAGVGSKRINEHLKHLQIEGVAAVSESSIYRLTKEIETNILWYKELQEEGLKEEAAKEMKELKVVLGLDETWLDEMLLVCQDLTSGYIFLKKQVRAEVQRTGGNR